MKEEVKSKIHLWSPKGKSKTDHPLNSARVVEVLNKRVRVFGSSDSWDLYDAVCCYGTLGPLLKGTK